MPQPLEGLLETDDLIENALIVGEGEKYTVALLFLSQDQLKSFAKRLGLEGEIPELLASDALQTYFKEVFGARQPRPATLVTHQTRGAYC